MIKDGLFIVDMRNADLTLRLEKAFVEYRDRMGVPPTAAVVHAYLLKAPRQISILGRLLSVHIGPIDRWTTWIGQANCHDEAISGGSDHHSSWHSPACHCPACHCEQSGGTS